MDIGFWEIMVIGIVALLVIGPERLPGVARTLGHWAGRGRAFVNTVKADMDRELRLQELQESMKLDEKNSLHEIIEETKSAFNSTAETSEAPPQKSASDPSKT